MFAPFRWLASVVAVLALVSSADAALYGFTRISTNGAQDVAAQLFVDVTDAGSGQVDFKFLNSGPLASSITDVYFDDGTLLGIASVINGPGVEFSQGASPGNLPGGETVTPPFEATAGFTADSDAPVSANGVNPGEFLTIRFNLKDGKTFADTIAALDGGVDLRIGIHVQGLPDGESDSFITSGQVPEPASIVAWLVCTSGLGLVLRSRMKKNAA